MRKRRYSDRDYHLWPFTLSLGCHRNFGVMLDSGADEDHRGHCHIRFYLRTATLICELPPLLRDQVKRYYPSWDDATVARLGRNWYDVHTPREFGFSLSDGNLHVHYGAQTQDSTTDKSRCFFLPWRNWRFIRRSLYDLQGRHFHTEFESARSDWQASEAIREACPKVKFEFDDYDGQRITATTHIEEREWRFGTGWFRWLSLLRRPKTSRDLMLNFNKEVGPEKGSWKGGTMGHSIEMLPGELHEAAFIRYCQQEHRAKGARFRIKYVGTLETAS